MASGAWGEWEQRIRSAARRRNPVAVLSGLLAIMLTVLTGVPSIANAAERPSAEDAFKVYQQVDQWLRDQALPSIDDPSESRRIDPENCAGASIVLRLSGQVIGRGEVIGEGGTTVWRAASEAWEAAYPRLIDNLPNDALYDERLQDRLERMTIDLQLAGPLVPLPAETYSAAGVLVNPGRQGVAARSGGSFGSVFPGAILTFPSTSNANFDPSERALRVAVTRLGLPPVDLKIVRQTEEVTLYRFDITHLAQTKAGTPPTFLVRGGRLVSEAAITTPNLRAAADEAAEYLIRLEWPGEEPLGMLGNYKAAADRYEPYVAPPREQATCAYALARYANTTGTAPARARHAAEYAASLLIDLTRVADDEIDIRTDPAALATWILAWAECTQAPGGLSPSDRQLLRDFAQQAIDELASEFSREAFTRLGPAAIALRAYAFAKAGAALGEDGTEALETARTDVRRLFRELPTPQLVTAMPWLGWAELELAAGEDSVPAGIALREMRELVWEFQIDPITAGPDDADFVGGIVFSRGSTQLPTWQGIRAIAFAATMLGDKRLTESQELFPQINGLIRSMRFIVQLSASEAEGHMYPDAERAQGGIRLALWDQTISVDATSLGLVAICEMLDALDKRSGD